MHPRIVLDGLQDLEHKNRVIGGESPLVSVEHSKRGRLTSKCGYSPAWKTLWVVVHVKAFLVYGYLLHNNKTSVCLG